MWVRVLGNLEIRNGLAWEQVRSSRERVVLASLVLASPGFVTVDELTDVLWGPQPPRTAANQIQGCVSRLRRLVEAHPDTRLLAVDHGYRLQSPPGFSDDQVFEHLAATAREAVRAGDLSDAHDAFSDMDELWRGTPFHELAERSAAGRAASERLTELRLACLEESIAADLVQGRAAEVLPRVRALVDEHPFREGFAASLMRALHRSGRSADALEVFRKLRFRLVDELGIEPCAQVTQAHREVLAATADQDETEQAETEQRGEHERADYVRLPLDVPELIGRERLVGRVVQALSRPGDSCRPTVVVLHGPPGMGKSAVAVHVAHLSAERFPVRIFLDAGGAAAPGDLLADVLRMLGAVGRQVPDDLSGRVALLSRMIAGRSLLMVLDDAPGSEQVLSVLPATHECAVLVTTRRVMTELPGAVHLSVEALSDGASTRLLSSALGSGRVGSDGQAAQEIVDYCAGSPLALRVAAGKLVNRPTWPLRVIAERLADEEYRLDELTLGGLDVRSTFAASLALMSQETQRAFDLLALLGPGDFPGWVVAALLGRSRAHDVLDALVDANLVDLHGLDDLGQPRYRLHDLLRMHAQERVHQRAAHECRNAVRGVVRAWLALVSQASKALPPSLFGALSAEPLEGLTPKVSEATSDPRAWLVAERAQWLQIVSTALQWDLRVECWQLVSALSPVLDHFSWHEDWRRIVTIGKEAAAGDDIGTAILLRSSAYLHLNRDETAEAEMEIRSAVELFRVQGDDRGRALALLGLAGVQRARGEILEALESAQQAGDVLGDASPEIAAACRGAVARSLLLSGDLGGARQYFDAGIELARLGDDQHRGAALLRARSGVSERACDWAAALQDLEIARQVFEDLQDVECEATCEQRRGEVLCGAGRCEEARAAFRSAAGLFGSLSLLSEQDEALRMASQLPQTQRASVGGGGGGGGGGPPPAPPPPAPDAGTTLGSL
ncbi:BTAD domain-containing putative transcriptional regulator [Dermacoccaceae bacterium W4C1]